MIEQLRHYNERGYLEDNPSKNGFTTCKWQCFDFVRREVDEIEKRVHVSPRRGPRGGVPNGFRCTSFMLEEALGAFQALRQAGWRTPRYVGGDKPIFRLRNVENGQLLNLVS